MSRNDYGKKDNKDCQVLPDSLGIHKFDCEKYILLRTKDSFLQVLFCVSQEVRVICQSGLIQN